MWLVLTTPRPVLTGCSTSSRQPTSQRATRLQSVWRLDAAAGAGEQVRVVVSGYAADVNCTNGTIDGAALSAAPLQRVQVKLHASANLIPLACLLSALRPRVRPPPTRSPSTSSSASETPPGQVRACCPLGPPCCLPQSSYCSGAGALSHEVTMNLGELLDFCRQPPGLRPEQ